MRHLVLATLLLSAVSLHVRAADQTVLGKQLIVGGTAGARKVVLRAQEAGSDDAIVGDPRVGGATLRVSTYGAAPSAQVFTLPGERWSATSPPGFSYDDATGPVKRARLKLSRGTFRLKAVIDGPPASVSLVPPNDGTGACALLAIDGGDSYSVRFGDGRVTNKGARSFKVNRPRSEGTCVPCGNGFLDAGEQCDPAGPACGSNAECQSDCTCLYIAPAQPSLVFDEQAAVAANGDYPAADPTTVCGANDRRFLAELVDGNPLNYRVPLRLADIKPAGSNDRSERRVDRYFTRQRRLPLRPHLRLRLQHGRAARRAVRVRRAELRRRRRDTAR